MTLDGRHNRFFIFRHPNVKTRVEKKFGNIYVEIDHKVVDVPESSVMVFAHRLFIKWQDKTEYPFVIMPSSMHITKFFLHSADTVVNDQIHSMIVQFFRK